MTLTPLLSRLTGFGDFALLSLLGLFVAGWLLSTGARRVALLWLIALGSCAALIALLKIYFNGCPLTELAMRSPSGHAGFGSFIYGGIALLARSQRPRWQAGLIALSGGLWIAAIGYSRVVVQAHTGPEVLFGIAIGASVLFGFGLASRGRDHSRFPLVAVVVGAALGATLFHTLDWHPTFEALLARLSHEYAALLPPCSTD